MGVQGPASRSPRSSLCIESKMGQVLDRDIVKILWPFSGVIGVIEILLSVFCCDYCQYSSSISMLIAKFNIVTFIGEECG